MTVLPQRRIGRDGQTTGILALGSWHTYDRMHFPDAVRMLRRAVDAGITLFDVGVYGTADRPPVFTDVLFSAMVRAAGLRRDDYLFSAKLWLEDYFGDNLREQLENALLRGGVEHADLVIVSAHPADTDLHALVTELAELHRAGLIRQWGVNNWSPASIRAAHDFAAADGVPGPSMAQLVYSVARRSTVEGPEFGAVFGDLGVTLQSSAVFECGRLLGKSRTGAEPHDDAQRRIADNVDALAKAAESIGATAAQLCLAFTLTHPANTTTLFGSTSVRQLEDNLAAADLLTSVGAAELRALAEPFRVDR
ncbi:aldo/keto reductase [Kutzneria chonburiensis]|uniref:Aldo/keto reductase n=1 Tax=Kutzneria chonburiensis TaxID=1483604 RepID=A0ABV6MNI6_9PSEU|nr:aldo/keto reductase [Kutzneria chonburiensis]